MHSYSGTVWIVTTKWCTQVPARDGELPVLHRIERRNAPTALLTALSYTRALLQYKPFDTAAQAVTQTLSENAGTSHRPSGIGEDR